MFNILLYKVVPDIHMLCPRVQDRIVYKGNRALIVSMYNYHLCLR